MNSWWQTTGKHKIGMAIVIGVAIQAAAMIGSLVAAYITQQDAVAEVLQRISLDTSRLDLGDDSLKSVANLGDIERYIRRLNDYLVAQDLPIVLSSINGVAIESPVSELTSPIQTSLLTNEQVVELTLLAQPIYSNLSISLVALLTVIAWLLLPTARHNASVSLPIADKPEPMAKAITLIIDLTQKTLYTNASNEPVILQNKPFCFYVALVRYCLQHPNAHLSHQQAVPDDLLAMANDTFARLVELGHTKRKRPDFSANLDKTLSEIRAVLDEIFIDNPKAKAPFYPPRAQGEGSRSKQHSYALHQLQNKDVSFIEN